MLLRLTGKTSKGKNRIVANGTDWFVLDWHSPIRKDSWFVLSSLTSEKRWIRKSNDPDFNVQILEM